MTHPGGTEDLPVGCETCQILASRKGCKILMKECLVIFHLPRLYLRHVIFYFLRIWPPTCLLPKRGRVLNLYTFPGYYVRRQVPSYHIRTNSPRPGGKALRREVASVTSSLPLFSLITSFPNCTPLPHPLVLQRTLTALIS